MQEKIKANKNYVASREVDPARRWDSKGSMRRKERVHNRNTRQKSNLGIGLVQYNAEYWEQYKRRCLSDETDPIPKHQFPDSNSTERNFASQKQKRNLKKFSLCPLRVQQPCGIWLENFREKISFLAKFSTHQLFPWRRHLLIFGLSIWSGMIAAALGWRLATPHSPTQVVLNIVFKTIVTVSEIPAALYPQTKSLVTGLEKVETTEVSDVRAKREEYEVKRDVLVVTVLDEPQMLQSGAESPKDVALVDFARQFCPRMVTETEPVAGPPNPTSLTDLGSS